MHVIELEDDNDGQNGSGIKKRRVKIMKKKKKSINNNNNKSEKDLKNI